MSNIAQQSKTDSSDNNYVVWPDTILECFTLHCKEMRWTQMQCNVQRKNSACTPPNCFISFGKDDIFRDKTQAYQEVPPWKKELAFNQSSPSSEFEGKLLSKEEVIYLQQNLGGCIFRTITVMPNYICVIKMFSFFFSHV